MLVTVLSQFQCDKKRGASKKSQLSDHFLSQEQQIQILSSSLVDIIFCAKWKIVLYCTFHNKNFLKKVKYVTYRSTCHSCHKTTCDKTETSLQIQTGF